LAATTFENRSAASKAEYELKQLSAARKRQAAATWRPRRDLPGATR